jgi:uncharacterized protein (TIGR03435 family)
MLYHTNLKGEFDFELVWDRNETADSPAPSIFTALQEQLGLRLKPRAERLRSLSLIASSGHRKIDSVWLTARVRQFPA